MATSSVRFEFYCDEDKELKFTHDLPRGLIDNAHSMGRDAAYNAQFAAAVLPLVKQHKADCRAAAPSTCEICDKAATSILQTPMSWLHNKPTPLVGVWVNAYCGAPACEDAVRKEVNESMAELTGGAISSSGQLSGGMNLGGCNVCGKKEDLKKCARCQVVSYCGRDHQRADWKSHKQYCTSA